MTSYPLEFADSAAYREFTFGDENYSPTNATNHPNTFHPNTHNDAHNNNQQDGNNNNNNHHHNNEKHHRTPIEVSASLYPPVQRCPSRQTGAIVSRHYDNGINPFDTRATVREAVRRASPLSVASLTTDLLETDEQQVKRHRLIPMTLAIESEYWSKRLDKHRKDKEKKFEESIFGKSELLMKNLMNSPTATQQQQQRRTSEFGGEGGLQQQSGNNVSSGGGAGTLSNVRIGAATTSKNVASARLMQQEQNKNKSDLAQMLERKLSQKMGSSSTSTTRRDSSVLGGSTSNMNMSMTSNPALTARRGSATNGLMMNASCPSSPSAQPANATMLVSPSSLTSASLSNFETSSPTTSATTATSPTNQKAQQQKEKERREKKRKLEREQFLKRMSISVQDVTRNEGEASLLKVSARERGVRGVQRTTATDERILEMFYNPYQEAVAKSGKGGGGSQQEQQDQEAMLNAVIHSSSTTTHLGRSVLRNVKKQQGNGPRKTAVKFLDEKNFNDEDDVEGKTKKQQQQGESSSNILTSEDFFNDSVMSDSTSSPFVSPKKPKTQNKNKLLSPSAGAGSSHVTVEPSSGRDLLMNETSSASGMDRQLMKNVSGDGDNNNLAFAKSLSPLETSVKFLEKRFSTSVHLGVSAGNKDDEQQQQQDEKNKKENSEGENGKKRTSLEKNNNVIVKRNIEKTKQQEEKTRQGALPYKHVHSEMKQKEKQDQRHVADFYRHLLPADVKYRARSTHSMILKEQRQQVLKKHRLKTADDDGMEPTSKMDVLVSRIMHLHNTVNDSNNANNTTNSHASHHGSIASTASGGLLQLNLQTQSRYVQAHSERNSQRSYYGITLSDVRTMRDEFLEKTDLLYLQVLQSKIPESLGERLVSDKFVKSALARSETGVDLTFDNLFRAVYGSGSKCLPVSAINQLLSDLHEEEEMRAKTHPFSFHRFVTVQTARDIESSFEAILHYVEPTRRRVSQFGDVGITEEEYCSYMRRATTSVMISGKQASQLFRSVAVPQFYEKNSSKNRNGKGGGEIRRSGSRSHFSSHQQQHFHTVQSAFFGSSTTNIFPGGGGGSSGGDHHHHHGHRKHHGRDVDEESITSSDCETIPSSEDEDEIERKRRETEVRERGGGGITSSTSRERFLPPISNKQQQQQVNDENKKDEDDISQVSSTSSDGSSESDNDSDQDDNDEGSSNDGDDEEENVDENKKKKEEQLKNKKMTKKKKTTTSNKKSSDYSPNPKPTSTSTSSPSTSSPQTLTSKKTTSTSKQKAHPNRYRRKIRRKYIITIEEWALLLLPALKQKIAAVKAKRSNSFIERTDSHQNLQQHQQHQHQQQHVPAVVRRLSVSPQQIQQQLQEHQQQQQQQQEHHHDNEKNHNNSRKTVPHSHHRNSPTQQQHHHGSNKHTNSTVSFS